MAVTWPRREALADGGEPRQKSGRCDKNDEGGKATTESGRVVVVRDQGNEKVSWGVCEDCMLAQVGRRTNGEDSREGVR